MANFDSLIADPCFSATTAIKNDPDLIKKQDEENLTKKEKAKRDLRRRYDLGPYELYPNVPVQDQSGNVSLKEERLRDYFEFPPSSLNRGCWATKSYNVYDGSLQPSNRKYNNFVRELAIIDCTDYGTEPAKKDFYGTTETVFEFRTVMYNRITTLIDFDFFAVNPQNESVVYHVGESFRFGKTRYFTCPIADDPWFNRDQVRRDEEPTKATFELQATVNHRVYINNINPDLILKDSTIKIKGDNINSVDQTFFDFGGGIGGLSSIPQKVNQLYTTWILNNSYKSPKYLQLPVVPDDSKLITCSDDCGRTINIEFKKKSKVKKYIQTVSKPPNSVPSWTVYAETSYYLPDSGNVTPKATCRRTDK